MIYIIIFFIILFCLINKESFDNYMLHTYESIQYPFYINPYLKNNKLLRLSNHYTHPTSCKSCNNSNKTYHKIYSPRFYGFKFPKN